MLIRFFTENFLSFNDLADFSMVPGKSRHLSDHIVRARGRNNINLLKAAIIYGANASGKSNLVKAMAFTRNLIVNGTGPKDKIPVDNFKLDAGSVKKPSKFQYDLKYKNKMYSYGFTVDQDRIYDEWLYETGKIREKMIFERKTIDDKKIKISFGKIDFKNAKERQFIEFVGKGTRSNQLFLTESINRNVPYFSDVYEWFDDVLIIIFPKSKPKGIEFIFDSEDNVSEMFIKLLQAFDTGISNIVTKKYSLEKDITEIPQFLITELEKELTKKNMIAILGSDDNKRYAVYKEDNGHLVALKLQSQHKIKGSNDVVNFEINQESDGTRRIIDLLPALTGFLASDKVFVIDELDRSLHPHLTVKFLDMFLKNNLNKKSQLIVTTHESNLLSLKLLRKDEIWFIEKNQNGESIIYSLEEFKPRKDKDIRRGYLLGRFGAIPFLKDSETLGWG